MTHGGNVQKYLYILKKTSRNAGRGLSYRGPAYDWEEIWQRRDSEGHRAGAKL